MIERSRFQTLALATAGLCAAPSLQAASCAAVEKAIEAGMKQPRIYAASFEQQADGSPGKATMAAVTIGSSHYLFDGGRAFGPTPLESEEMRQMGSGLIGFAPGEICKALGAQAIAGRGALKFSYVTDLGNGPANITLWIDRATGLPLRGVTDEPDVDVDVNFSKDGDLETRKRPTGKRVKQVSGFLFGDQVKAPEKKKLDADMQSSLRELLK
jgi:hypothetical protein